MNLFLKKYQKSFLLCLVGTFIMLIGIIRYSDVNNNPFSINAKDAYIPRAEIGELQWQTMSREQRWEALQISKSQLDNMSTAGLVESVVEYPFAFDLYYYESMQVGFDIVGRNFDIMQSLFTRPDASVQLINLYKNVSPEIESHWENPRIAEHVTKLNWLEMVIAQPEIIDSLTVEDRKNLLWLSYVKLQKKLQIGSNIYSPTEIIPTVLIAGRIMYKDSDSFSQQVDSDVDLKNFLDNGEISRVDYEITISLYRQLESYISSNSIGLHRD